ncbi:MAG: hypothetical protein HPY60_10770 [Candidatus Methanofastidiosum sp.]|nr:hypothetical protein [Methanofastidiosum sp.]
MKLLDKNELKSNLGKENFWMPKRLVGKLSYISGIEPFDKLLGGKLFTEVIAVINLSYRTLGLQIEMMKNFKTYNTGITEGKIISIHLEDKEQLYEMKDKSVIGRAVIGGLILGPVGAIIGGMTGIGKKEVKSNMPEMILSISYESDDKEKNIILFSCKHKDRESVEMFFKENYSSKFQTTKQAN